ncbi:cytochrome P450 2K6 [Bombina bombina]|uniref:cytochrome P450 2K6 n=1 Tax=Bombina bombina TaxID=8345 RepID=UPI00235A68F7|nr:cytochrome P450 2K6 [Bombina bombina]XP_053565550.1 cytochrome P450 2K6 [Bombina bombina]XP_053565551.1 cytochrome P450 2K6 [Bombina bombina]XP_053565553.1 cytochrome P450 2K6 [Bombina bombina]XP_053565554.1 cytochrome P450 2K6 [Bombina bombina]XP_053565555.1 cytochrome P450 2K6 [Bombina bombina]XP_053565556.1 cytochrome P450 2K6 [Bombina bombina]
MVFTDPITIGLTIILCLCLRSLLYGWNRNAYKNFPPGPKPLPLIGNLHIMDKKEPYKTLMELSKQYGPVFSIQMGTQPLVVLCGYDAIKEALVDHAEEFSWRGKLPIFDDVSKGHGVVFANGENWKVMRRFTLSTLRDFGMGKKSLEDQINEECNSLIEKFESYKGQPFENTMIMNAAVANIIVSILLDHRYDYEDPVLLRLMKTVHENIKHLGHPMVMLYNTYPSLIRWLPGIHTTIRKNVNEFHHFIRETFAKHKEKLNVNDQRNLIDVYLVKQQQESIPGQYFNNENLVHLVGDLFGAGMETTSTTLRWGFLIMMKYPEIQKNVQNEIEKVIGSAHPHMEHRKKMPYTDAVINEIQRFGNIVPAVSPREVTQDVTLKGYFLPKGTSVLPVLASALQDKKYFEKPDEFYPQHFLDSEGNFVKKEALIPFSAGRRNCAGENLAKTELFLFFTRLLQKFTFQLPPGVSVADLTPAVGLTRGPKPYLMCVLPRT